MGAITPVLNGLIVDDERRLRQEASEACLQSEIACNRSRIVRPARTPQVDDRALRMKGAYTLDNPRDRYSLCSDPTNQRVIDIHIHDHFHCISPTTLSSALPTVQRDLT